MLDSSANVTKRLPKEEIILFDFVDTSQTRETQFSISEETWKWDLLCLPKQASKNSIDQWWNVLQYYAKGLTYFQYPNYEM